MRTLEPQETGNETKSFPLSLHDHSPGPSSFFSLSRVFFNKLTHSSTLNTEGHSVPRNVGTHLLNYEASYEHNFDFNRNIELETKTNS
jgi:hypothetical protein